MEVQDVLAVGIDLGKKSKHVAVAVDEMGRELGKPYKFNTSA